jgi:hypothetical protein
MLRRVLIAAIVLALILAPVGRTRATTVPPADSMFGVSVNRIVNDDFTPAHWDAPLRAVAASGIRQARTDAFWGWAEPAPPLAGRHSYQWSMPDAVAGALVAHGLRWLPVIDYSAPWAATDPHSDHSPPRSNDDYAAYAGAFAARYGRGGSYWALHPDERQLPVTTYEIWNEPNGASFWHPTPDPAVYADMYLKARAAIKAVNPQATVVVGGLVAHPGFVRDMYVARPDLRGNVDAIGWHPYAPSVKGVISAVRDLRRTLVGLGEGGVPIHVTEIGWPTHGTGHAAPIVQGEAERAASLETATDELARSDCGVSMVVPYTWTTPERDPTAAEDWYGIRHPDGSLSPAAEAFARVVARWTSDPLDGSARLRLCD